LDSANAEKANADAQLVLKGVIGASDNGINLTRGDVAGDLYKQLTEAQVEISAQTFTLMIEACACVQDLKGASDFLMRMETAGFTPESALLDKVMDMYVAQRAQKGQQENQQTHVQEDEIELQRPKLSKQAAVFVPSFVPPPPTAPRPTNCDEKNSSGKSVVQAGDSKLNDKAAGFVPGEPSDEGLSQRTRLTSASKPWMPEPCEWYEY